MKLPRQLTKRQLVKIVEETRDILYMDDATYDELTGPHATVQDKHFANRLKEEQPRRLGPSGSGHLDFLNPNKEWDEETVEDVAQVLARRGLQPSRLVAPSEAYRKPTPNENWKDDSIQFPRLLNELDCLAVVDLLDAADQTNTGMQALKQSMDLTRGDIMELFRRAQKEWDRIKKETR